MAALPRYLARGDRLALCDLFDHLGPDAPTLCDGWTTHDLAAHLVARDCRPDSVPGLVVHALAGWSERVRLGERIRPYPDLVNALRAGPPRWSPLHLPRADRAGNTHEFFVHLEDVRRASPGWEPRVLDGAADDDLWRVLGWFGRRAFSRAKTGVVLRRPGGAAHQARKGAAHQARKGAAHQARKGAAHQARKGAEDVTLTGPPGELLLFAFGRREHALVTVDGSPEAVALLAATTLSW